MGIRKELSNMKFGRLTAISQVDEKRERGDCIRWLCKCDCGNELIVGSAHLNSGHSKSCGCLRRDKTIKRSTKHGNNQIGKISSEYISWIAAHTRCFNSKSTGYDNYGGRGITMCDRWKNSFENFLLDMGQKPTPKHTLERDNVNGDYEPSNCIWATKLEQGANTRKNVYFEYKGLSFHLAEWARRLGVPQCNFSYHYKKHGGVATIERFLKQKL